jgi:hypothetical protein
VVSWSRGDCRREEYRPAVRVVSTESLCLPLVWGAIEKKEENEKDYSTSPPIVVLTTLRTKMTCLYDVARSGLALDFLSQLV